jgi:DNA-binding GntR family transcriptional regulator
VEEPIDQMNNGSLADQAYEAIRQTILRCDLVPGEQVSESQLSESFGFGRAAVRAALVRLCHERLLRAIPRHGYVVASITFKHVRDLFGVRQIVEPAAARLAAVRSDDEIVRYLENLNEACARTGGQQDPAPLRDANKRFHVGVAEVADNERLAEMTSIVMDEMDRVLHLPQLVQVWDRIDATYEEHRLIIEAIRAHDAAAAEQATIDHIVLNKHFVIDGLIASPRLRSINLVGS